jgi:hypothetical protein
MVPGQGPIKKLEDDLTGRAPGLRGHPRYLLQKLSGEFKLDAARQPIGIQ